MSGGRRGIPSETVFDFYIRKKFRRNFANQLNREFRQAQGSPRYARLETLNETGISLWEFF